MTLFRLRRSSCQGIPPKISGHRSPWKKTPWRPKNHLPAGWPEKPRFPFPAADSPLRHSGNPAPGPVPRHRPRDRASQCRLKDTGNAWFTGYYFLIDATLRTWKSVSELLVSLYTILAPAAIEASASIPEGSVSSSYTAPE